jgi:Mg-chelatase subunit ChlD
LISLILSEKADTQDTPVEKVFGNTETGNGIKVTYSADKSTVSAGKDNLNASYDLSGFGSADVNENAVELVIVVDESGSMAAQIE